MKKRIFCKKLFLKFKLIIFLVNFSVFLGKYLYFLKLDRVVCLMVRRFFCKAYLGFGKMLILLRIYLVVFSGFLFLEYNKMMFFFGFFFVLCFLLLVGIVLKRKVIFWLG